VREFTAPAVVDGHGTARLTDAVVRRAADSGDVALFSRRDGSDWQPVTAAEFRDHVTAVARGLLGAGVRSGDRVVLMSSTRYEWAVFDYAIWWVGAVTVPVYETSPADQLGWILSDSGAVAAVVESPRHRERLDEPRERPAALEHVWTIDDRAVETLTGLGSGIDDETLEERRAAVAPGDLATLIYTSGTTGRPKGCMLTHANLCSEVDAAVEALRGLFDMEDASTLLSLPLPHVFARVVQVACVSAGVRLAHSFDVRTLQADLEQIRPTFLLSVPRVFEKLFTAASQQAHGEGRGRVFDAAATVAIDYSRRLESGRIGPVLRARHRMYDRLVYRRLRATLGGRVRYAVAGGAPMGERLAHFFRGLGVTVLEGYGLTETSAAVCVNQPDAIRVGTVGRPMAGISVRVADDGELLVKGPQVFAGYWHDEDATRGVLDDGWLYTGDVGEIDDDGYVRVTGRKKEMLVTAGGKSVVPAALEDAVRSHPLVSQCLVVGEARPFVAALVTLDPEALLDWAGRHGKAPDPDSLATDAQLVAEIQQAVDAANATVSSAEAIRTFRILSTDWTERSGHLTPTLKLRRTAVLRDFGGEIDTLYRPS
jgi:long-chain acyl-CoA synthetase